MTFPAPLVVLGMRSLTGSDCLRAQVNVRACGVVQLSAGRGVARLALASPGMAGFGNNASRRGISGNTLGKTCQCESGLRKVWQRGAGLGAAWSGKTSAVNGITAQFS